MILFAKFHIKNKNKKKNLRGGIDEEAYFIYFAAVSYILCI